MQTVTVFMQGGKEITVERANQAKINDSQVIGGTSTLDVDAPGDKGWNTELRAQFLLSEVTGYRINDDNTVAVGE